jgi:hypothetical protein
MRWPIAPTDEFMGVWIPWVSGFLKRTAPGQGALKGGLDIPATHVGYGGFAGRVNLGGCPPKGDSRCHALFSGFDRFDRRETLISVTSAEAARRAVVELSPHPHSAWP